MIESLVEVTLKQNEDFLKVKETLTRIGISSKKDKILYQSCHILHKREKYYIVHFKELFALDGRETNFNEDDEKRRNTIIGLLEEWGLINVVIPEMIEKKAPLNLIKIISFSDKKNWVLTPKYNIGKK